MSIKDFVLKIKSFSINTRERLHNLLEIRNDLFIVFLIILTGTASFGLGKLSALEKQKVPISILKTKEAMYASVAESPIINSPKNIDQTIGEVVKSQQGIVVASKSGTKYYYPSCSGVSRIKEENKVWFNSIADAEAKGLTLAANCAAQ